MPEELIPAEYAVRLVSVMYLRREGHSDRQHGRAVKGQRAQHRKNERLRRARYQRHNNGSLRGYVPVNLLIINGGWF